MAPALVNVQSRSSSGNDQYGSYVDCSHLQVDDFVVIGLASLVSGGGFTWYNQYSGIKYPHISGPFGVSGDIFGHIDGGMVSGAFGMAQLLRHKVTAADLVDGGGGPALERIGWQHGGTSVSAGSSFTMWTMRGVTYSSKTSGSTNSSTTGAGPLTTGFTPGGTLDIHQAMFIMGGCTNNGGNATPNPKPKSVSNDAGVEFTQQTPMAWAWTWASAWDADEAVDTAHTFGTLATPGTVTFTFQTAADPNTTYYGACYAIVTFVEDIGPPKPVASEPFYLPPSRVNLKTLPNNTYASILKGL